MLTTLKAIRADRWIPPQMRTAATAKRFAALLGLCFAFHLGLLVAAFLGESFLAKAPIQPQVIPVELIEEPPPEPPQEKPEEKPEDKPLQQAEDKPAEPPPPPKEQQEPEKAEAPPPPVNLEPASDFARVSEREIENKTAGGPVVAEREEPAPIAQAEPPREVEQPKAEQKLLPEPAKPEPIKPAPPVAQAPETSPTPEALPPEPEGLLAAAQARPVETPPPPEAAPEPAPAPESTQPENPIGKRFAFFDPLPKMEFDAGVKSSRAPSGTAPANYNSTLYGMIVPLIHFPPGADRFPRRGPAAVGFVVDGRGRLAQITIVRASGVPSIDLAVVAAIREAAPYPPPPNGLPLGLEMHY